MWSNISAPTSRSSLQQLAEAEQRSGHHHHQDDPSEEFSETQVENQGIGNQSGSPLMRYKHAVCSSPNGFIYIHGGRFGNSPLDDDIWRFDPHHNNWLQLATRGCKPPCLQEHTLVEFNERLYLFGGQVSTSNTESSFWCLDLVSSEWRSLSMKSSKFGAHLGPTNRRGHSAVIYGHSMYVYGGFEDFRGSSGQLWEYDLNNESWELRNLSSSSAVHPEPRHSHSAIVCEDNMYIYGGLSNLKPLGDLWRWSWRDKRWYKERTRGRSPGQLHGHTAIQAFGSMFVFGGERDGRTTRSLWRLNLSNMAWQKVRPKGPRPSPTTWHGAIANPLSIIDEANYIIEGDSELLKLSNGSSSHMLDAPQPLVNGNKDLAISRKQKECPHLSHSKSSNVGATQGWTQQAAQPVASGAGRSSKRKSRLNFLRRNRQDRPKSTYELKQIQVSASVNNLPITKTNRHSIHFAPINTTKEQQQHQLHGVAAPPKLEPETQNVKILDNLDTDIKKMFQRAMSPHGAQEASGKRPISGFYDENEEDESMSVDTTNQEPSSVCNTGTSRRSHYVTARQTDRDSLGLAGHGGSTSGPNPSQRTSYAYTTPPSELNTLTRDSMLISDKRKQANELGSNMTTEERVSALLAETPTDLPLASGYDRRSNRPKSEIVQSLIERADARIKHLYTPFFNQPTTSAGGRDQRRHRINRLSLDKSKRHTIPQTMTYYNLYFSEDKSSNSPPTSGQEDAAMDEEDVRATNGTFVGGGKDSSDVVGARLTRDDGSSSTIKGSAGVTSVATSRGTLVGVHGYLNPAIVAQLDQVSQLSFESVHSSESRTLCANEHTLQRLSGAHHTETPQTFSAMSNLESSLQNALTARKDNNGESCDNTSLSFSIAELEEDDMLQYSSPTDHPIMRPSEGRTHIDVDHDRGEHNVSQKGFLASAFVERELRGIQEDVYKKMPTATRVEEDTETEVVGTMNDSLFASDKATTTTMAHKSASSGYNSMSGFEQQQQSCNQLNALLSRDKYEQPSPSGQSSSASASHQDHLRRLDALGEEFNGASEDTTHENSSVRTESSFNLTTETSPEQSALKNQHKKLRRRPFLNGKLDNNNKYTAQTTTSSSITADSLALTSDAFECSSIEPSPARPTQTKSLPSSPPENGCRHALDTQHDSHNSDSSQWRVPLISTRSRLFGKRKSKTRYWQLCMFVIGGKQSGAHGLNEPITIWRLYI